ncbi:MAG: HipA domain-containing protein [Sphaerochaeta sp.]
MKRLTVWMGEQIAGTWVVSKDNTLSFQYDESYLANDNAIPLSRSIPLQSEIIEGPFINDFFGNLLPESEQLQKNIKARFLSSSITAFDLLAEVGRDASGALQILPPGEEPLNDERVLTEAELRVLLDDVVYQRPLEALSKEERRFTLAGAQAKIPLCNHHGQWVAGGTSTHILKVPMGSFGPLELDLLSSVENEYLCMKLAKALGFPVAECSIEYVGELPVLVVTRFDRKVRNNTIVRIHQEDFCQSTNTSAPKKYERDGGPGIRTIMEVLKDSQNPEHDRKTFFMTQVLFWLLAAIDGHGKNFSIFLGKGGRFRLTPLYDIISAYPVMGSALHQIHPRKLKMAMVVQGSKRYYEWNKIQSRHYIEMGKSLGFDPTSAMGDLAEKIPQVIEKVSGELPSHFPQGVSEPIFEGVLNQARRLKNLG